MAIMNMDLHIFGNNLNSLHLILTKIDPENGILRQNKACIHIKTIDEYVYLFVFRFSAYSHLSDMVELYTTL